MAYVPPSRRKLKIEDEKYPEFLRIAGEYSDKHFPSLCGNGHVVSRDAISYGEKSKEWEQRRIESELKIKVDAKMAEYRAEKKKQEEIEHLVLPNFSRKREQSNVTPLPILESIMPEVPSEEKWITVQKKPRKPKKEFNYDEEPRYDEHYDHISQDEDFGPAF
jgi:hypothetical protein